MLNCVADGRSVKVNVRASELSDDIRSGQLIKVGGLIGITATSVLRVDSVRFPLVDQADERSFNLYLENIYELPCDASSFELGEYVYADPATAKPLNAAGSIMRFDTVTAKPVDSTKAIKIGVATEMVTRDGPHVRVRLDGVSV